VKAGVHFQSVGRFRTFWFAGDFYILRFGTRPFSSSISGWFWYPYLESALVKKKKKKKKKKNKKKKKKKKKNKNKKTKKNKRMKPAGQADGALVRESKRKRMRIVTTAACLE